MTNMKKILLSLGSLTAVAGSVSAIAACGEETTSTVKSPTKEAPNAAKIDDKANDSNVKMTAFFKTLEDNKAEMTTEKLAEILTSIGVQVDMDHGTSAKARNIGNKYNDIDDMVENIKNADGAINFEILTAGLNEQYHVPAMVKQHITWALEGQTSSTENSKPDSSNNSGLNSVASVEATGRDAYWVSGLTNSYSEDLPTAPEGTRFYSVAGEFDSTPTLDAWINTYETELNDNSILGLFNGGEASNYKASNPQFIPVYGPDSTLHTFGLYSGCDFKVDAGNHVRTFNKDTCNIDKSRNLQNGWEHVSPQSGIKNALTSGSVLSRHARADLHNLRPSIQNEFNGPRGNHPFGIVEGESTKYGIDFEIGNSVLGGATVTEPRESVRGDIARILFYMHDVYHVTYEKAYYELLIRWASLDPVDSEEIALDSAIASVMGIHNPYVTATRLLPVVAGEMALANAPAPVKPAPATQSKEVSFNEEINALKETASKGQDEDTIWSIASKVSDFKAESETAGSVLKADKSSDKTTLTVVNSFGTTTLSYDKLSNKVEFTFSPIVTPAQPTDNEKVNNQSPVVANGEAIDWGRVWYLEHKDEITNGEIKLNITSGDISITTVSVLQAFKSGFIFEASDGKFYKLGAKGGAKNGLIGPQDSGDNPGAFHWAETRPEAVVVTVITKA